MLSWKPDASFLGFECTIPLFGIFGGFWFRQVLVRVACKIQLLFSHGPPSVVLFCSLMPQVPTFTFFYPNCRQCAAPHT